MPTYEFKCPNGHVFEKFFQQMSDKQHERCPKCGKRATRLISGGVGLVFKGSGFYTTDYKRAGEKQEQKEQKPPEEASKPAAESKPAEPKSAERSKKKKDSGDK